MPRFEQIQHPSNTKRRKRVGRGIAGGQGKTAGRGQKGYGSRSGNTEKPRFEGGQQPLVRHLPKMGGFKHHSKVTYHAVNLGKLADAPDGTTIDLLYLERLSLLPKRLRGLRVKLLAGGETANWSKKLNFRLNAYSHTARELVEKAGGSCEVL